MIRIASNLVALAAALAISAACSAAAAESDKFCAQIRAIAADAANGFVAMRGQQTRQEKQEATSTDPTTNIVDHYAASETPEGATSCEITANDSADSRGRHHPIYRCQFPIAGKDKGAALRKLADRATACLPGFSRPIGPGLNKDGGLLIGHPKDYSLDLFASAGPASATMELWIGSNWK